MAITIDTSAVLAIIQDEPTKAAVLAAIGTNELVAPASLPWEVGNALSALFKRRAATAEHALAALQLFHKMPVTLIDVPLDLAINFAATLQIYAYDAYMLACAKIDGGSLLTLDRGLLATARRLSIPLVEVTP